MAVQIQLRRDTASNWTGTNPVLAIGEPGVETDTLKVKVGDGATAWNSLAYSISYDFNDLNNKPTTLAGYGITDGGSVTAISTTTFTNKSGNISQWTNDSSYLTSVPAQSFSSLTGKPTTVAGYGITDALALGTSSTTALAGDTALFDGAYGSLSGAPTLGTAAATASTAYATAAQGTTADSAIQPNTSPTLTNATLTGYLAGPASFVIDPAAVGDDTGTVVIAGNLQVDGVQTTINSTTVSIDDLKLSVATDAADSAAANGAGITVGGANANITYTHATTSWDFDKPVNVTGNIGVTGTVDGVDIAARDAILTSTTTTAGAALPKAGGTMTGDLLIQKAEPIINLRRSDNTKLPGLLWQGSAGAQAASIRMDGDSGTTNSIVMSTYNGSSVAERLRILTDAADGIQVTGKVGIGTDAPDTELHVFNSDSGATPTSNTVATFEGNDNTEISILGGSSSILALNFGHSGDNNEGIVYFNTTSGSENLQLQSTKDITLVATSANGTAGDINFKSYNTTIMHVDGGNNRVGIGTDAPSETFHVQKAADDKLVYGSNPRLLLDTPTGINGLRVLGDTTPFEFKIDSGTYNGSAFQMGGTGDLSFIGTTTTASDTFNDSPTFFFNSQRWNGSANSTHFQGAIKGHTRSATNGDGYLGIGASADANHLNIQPNGNIGIGKTAPSTRLDVQSSAGGLIAKFFDTGSNGGAQYNGAAVVGISRVGNGSVSLGGPLFQVGNDTSSSTEYNIDEPMFTVTNTNVGINTDDVRGTLGIGTGLGGGNVPANTSILLGSDDDRNIQFLGQSANGVEGTIGAWNGVYNFQSSKIVFNKPAGNVGEMQFHTNAGAGPVNRMTIQNGGTVAIVGALSKGSGSFKIDHPLPSKTETHNLVHSFVESPQANNIYRGKVVLVDGSATVNIDIVSGMTDGTYVLLNTNTQCFTSNETGWTAVKGSVSGNTLTINSEVSCTDTISWMVVGERHDQHMIDTDWTNDEGQVIVEPLKND